MNNRYLRKLDGADANYFDVEGVSNSIEPGAYSRLPYTSKVLAEQLIRRCEPAAVNASLSQLIERKRDRDFP